MENKLLDGYFASGKDAKSFIAEMKELTMRTSYHFVDPSDAYLLSYHKTVDKHIEGTSDKLRTYYFYKLDRANLSKLEKCNNGLSLVPFVIKIQNNKKTAKCEFFEEIIKNTGLLLAYGDEEGKTHYNGVSRYGLITLCKKAEVKGDRVYEKGLFRDMYIADGLLVKSCDNVSDKTSERNDCLLSDGFKIVVRHNLEKNQKGKLVKTGFGAVVGVFSDTYNERGMTALVELYELIRENKSLGKTKFVYWESDQGYSSANIEFPEAANTFQKKYNLPVKLVPGIQMVSSDCGLSSLVVSGTCRVENSKSTFVVSEYTRKHSGNFSIPDIMNIVEKTVIQEIEPFIASVAKLVDKPLGGDFDLKTERGKQNNREAIHMAINNGFEKLSLPRILGQRRSTLVKTHMLESFSEDVAYTYYDVVEAFFCMEKYIEKTTETTSLGKTAKDNLIREIPKIIQVDFKKVKSKKKKEVENYKTKRKKEKGTETAKKKTVKKETTKVKKGG